MKIRPALDTDLDSLVDLNEQIAWFHHDNAPNVFVAPGQSDRDFLKANLEKPDVHFWVAEQDDRLIGFVSANITRNTEIPFLTDAPIAWIKTIVVDEAHRSSGVGQALVAAVTDWAKQEGAVEIRLQVMEFNDNAQSFYQKLGYSTLSRTMSLNLSE